jgi:hypothetical protein
LGGGKISLGGNFARRSTQGLGRGSFRDCQFAYALGNTQWFPISGEESSGLEADQAATVSPEIECFK